MNLNRQRAAGGLPPEVEAELRRRVQAASAVPAAPAAVPPPLADFNLSAAGEPPRRLSGPPVPPKPGFLDRLKAFGPAGIFLVFILGKLKFLGFAWKFLLPALKTGSTMLVSIWFYQLFFGWKFAAGFVLCILVHELGHVFAAWRLGIRVSAPVFIPGMGALILQKQVPKSAWDQAIIGIGGPVGGTLAALACWGLYYLTGNPLLLALTYTAAFLNLFNLIPLVPLDGGWITGAVSPRIWLFGAVGMGALFLSGWVRNPFILLLLLLSLPRLWHGLRHGDATPEGGIPVTSHQRITMGTCYVSLCAFLVWLMAHTHLPIESLR
jgi:Zn-dependent protease